MPEAVVVAVGRSPIGRANKGSLKDARPDDLGAYVLRQVLDRVPIQDTDVEDVLCGCGLPGGEQGFNLGRAISVLAGVNAPGTTVTRYCSSSLQTTRMAAHAIRSGEGDVFVSVGVECVSRYVNGHSDPLEAENPRLVEGASDEVPWLYIPMGLTAENVARREGVTREEMDLFALESQRRAVAAQDAGFFEREIVPIPLPDGSVVAVDDGPRRDTSLDKLAALQPAFVEDGLVTAGNSCPLNDGAAAVVLISDRKAAELGIKPLARIVSTAVSALEPEYMGLGPIAASRNALERAELSIGDLDIVEINEAFAAQVIPSARALGVPFEKLNPFGGSLALGHPFGMTGARILGTLINGLETIGGRFGLETMCVGGGMGMAMVIERVP